MFISIYDLSLITQHKYIMFEGDNSIVINSINIDVNHDETKINDTLKSVVDWLNRNNLQENLKKN